MRVRGSREIWITIKFGPEIWNIEPRRARKSCARKTRFARRTDAMKRKLYVRGIHGSDIRRSDFSRKASCDNRYAPRQKILGILRKCTGTRSIHREIRDPRCRLNGEQFQGSRVLSRRCKQCRRIIRVISIDLRYAYDIPPLEFSAKSSLPRGVCLRVYARAIDDKEIRPTVSDRVSSIAFLSRHPQSLSPPRLRFIILLWLCLCLSSCICCPTKNGTAWTIS